MRVWQGVAGLALGLIACGGRSIDDGAYDQSGAVSSTSRCALNHVSYADGSLIPGACLCFCNVGKIECEAGCTSTGGSSSSGGAGGTVATGGTIATGGTGTGGTGVAGSAIGGFAGTLSTGGSTSAGGSFSMGGSMSTGGVATAGSAGSVGGAAGAAGAGGFAGSSCGSVPRVAGFHPLIDDMEDGDPFIANYEGRGGPWFTYNDSTPGAVQIPSPGSFAMQFVNADASGGRFAAVTAGKGFRTWGAGMGLLLNYGCPYDASGYSGVRFYMRADNGNAQQVLVLLPTAATTPYTENGTCFPGQPSACYDDFQATRTAIGSGWQEFDVGFNELQQQGWGTRVSFDPSTLIGINFQTPYARGSFGFSIDNITFF